MVARKKASKPQQHRWRITLTKSPPARYLGSIEASDEQAALAAAAVEFKVAGAVAKSVGRPARDVTVHRPRFS